MAIADPGDDGTPCPLSPTPVEVQIVRERMAIGLYDMPARRGGPDILVPLTIHVVRRTDGTGGLTPAQVLQAIDGANDLWLGSGIQFCTPGETIYIDERTVDVHIGRLRKAINQGRAADVIRTIRGAGYAIRID